MKPWWLACNHTSYQIIMKPYGLACNHMGYQINQVDGHVAYL